MSIVNASFLVEGRIWSRGYEAPWGGATHREVPPPAFPAQPICGDALDGWQAAEAEGLPLQVPRKKEVEKAGEESSPGSRFGAAHRLEIQPLDCPRASEGP